MNNDSKDCRMSRKAIMEELSKIEVSDIMIPRSEVVLLNLKSSFEELVDIVINDGHSRFPVFSNKIDNIVGVLYVKDLLQYFKKKANELDLQSILRKPVFVPENKKTSDMLSEFREERIHIAIVVDEYGTMLGIVSLEDILEEIVGDISDEYDQVDDNAHFSEVAKDQFLVSPKMPLEEFNQVFKTRITSENYETVGGFILDRFGYVPKEGEEIQYGNHVFEIKSVQGSRIQQILMKKA